MKHTLLIIDDDNDFRSDLILLLQNNYDCLEAVKGNEGLEKCKQFLPDIVLLDLMLQDGTNGLEILKKIKEFDNDIPVIMITDYSSVTTAVEALKLGAEDYISKTPNLDELDVIIKRILENKIKDFQKRTMEADTEREFSKIIGDSQAITYVKNQINLFSENKNTVLITGESGVGKELVARQIHYKSGRRKEVFLAINCSAIPKDLLESELFGHERGAFTGAAKRKFGKFEVASKGTLFLDEISELDVDAQVKLLRVLQFKEFQRIGGTKNITSDVRIIAATNRKLEQLVSTGHFREDLYYRLNVLPIIVPPLRERKEDIPAMANHFSKIISYELKIAAKPFSDELLVKFANYDWPGNIRELQNFVTRALIVSKGEIITSNELGVDLFSSQDLNTSSGLKIPETWQEMDNLRKEEADKAARNIEKLFLENLLSKFGGNISKAAEHIGINRTNLHKMIKKCGL